MFGIPDPHIIVQVIEAAVRINARHGRCIGFIQIFGLAGKAYPAEGAIPVIGNRPHDIFKIGGIDKSVLGIHTVFRHLGNTGIKHRVRRNPLSGALRMPERTCCSGGRVSGKQMVMAGAVGLLIAFSPSCCPAGIDVCRYGQLTCIHKSIAWKNTCQRLSQGDCMKFRHSF
ncbi:hypothetical protein [Desulfobacter sp.]|uniref:hypothetical protein n=1 Tax=Desulfobacter sp. TaxID=2294 RepID=UPI002581192D|nr:hypothetical protein [Desulfobacter sp.]